jgi:hypothetical protein
MRRRALMKIVLIKIESRPVHDMKPKNHRDKSTSKKPYVSPHVSVLQPEHAKASKLADAIAGTSSANCQEITTNPETRLSKVKKRKLPRSA